MEDDCGSERKQQYLRGIGDIIFIQDKVHLYICVGDFNKYSIIFSV